MAASEGCQSLGGKRLENRVLDEVFAMLEPASLAATAKALAEADANHRRHIARLRAGRRARPLRSRSGPPPVRRRRAREPSRGPDPRALARAGPWRRNDRPRRTSLAQRLRQPTRLTEEETAWLERAGADVRAVFHAPTTTWRERKQLLRAVITEVVVTVHAEERRADVNIVWEGGAPTSVRPSTSTRRASTSAPPTRTPSTSSADWLSAMTTRRSPPSCRSRAGAPAPDWLFTKTRVKSLRVSRGIAAYPPPTVVTPDRR